MLQGKGGEDTPPATIHPFLELLLDPVRSKTQPIPLTSPVSNTPPPATQHRTPLVASSPSHLHTNLVLPITLPSIIHNPTTKSQPIHVPDGISKSISMDPSLCSSIVFHMALFFTHGLPEPFNLPSAAHPAVGILRHLCRQGAPISAVATITPSNLFRTKYYG